MAATHHIVSGRARLAADVTGEGDPIVFLHAAVFDRSMWRAQVDALSATHRAIAYDRRGFGETRAEPEDHSAVEDLLAVIDALCGGSAVTLVACSQGGRIALDFALAHPTRVRALVLISSSVSGAPAPDYPPAIRPLMSELAAAEAARDWDRVSAIKTHIWLDGPLQAEGRVGGALRRQFRDLNLEALQAPPIGTSIASAPAYPHLGAIAAPTLVISGDLDFPHIRQRSRMMAATMPNASFQEIIGAAHLVSLERPAEVNALIGGFLASH